MDKDSDALGVGWVERRRLLGAAIRRARHPMSQTEVGAAVHRPQSCVSVWEEGGIELGVDRVFELEELFGLRHGELLEAGGYIEPRVTCWWLQAEASVSDMAMHTSKDAAGFLGEFPRRLCPWLAEHGALVEAAAMLSEQGRDPVALEALRSTARLGELNLGWTVWAASCDEAGISTDVILAGLLAPVAVDRCELALWDPPGRDVGTSESVTD